MKWYTIPSVLICGLNSMLAATIMCLAAFHLYTDKTTNAPIRPNEHWICLVTCLLPFAAVWMLISIAGIYTSMARRKMLWASVIISLLAIVFGGSVYFTISFGNQLEMEDVPSDTLFNITMTQIAKEDTKGFVPEWLENVQKQSSQCCGVVTYRDYEHFWPDTPTKIPRSCCRDSKDLPTPCPGDLTQIPFPNTPANYIKVETGCMDEINEAARHHIRESYQNSIIMNIFIGLSVFAYLILYVKRYLTGETEPECTKEVVQIAGIDYASELSGPKGDSGVIITSNNQIATTSLDSMDPNLIMVSAESVTVPDHKASQSYYYNKDKEAQKDVPQISLSRPQPSMTKLNKANAVFAGLQQQLQPQAQRPTEASTGDDMTIGGNNIGRREIYLAQDATERPERERRNVQDKQSPPSPLPQPNQLAPQRVAQGSVSGDDIGDVIHSEQEPNSGSPPGSPGGGRKKKVRKLGASHHGHHHKNRDGEREPREREPRERDRDRDHHHHTKE